MFYKFLPIFVALSTVVAQRSAVACSRSIKTDCWENLAPLLSPRAEHASAVVGREVYIVGGLVLDPSDPNARPTTNLVEAYNIDTNTWSRKAPLPVLINHANVASVNGLLYVLGGLSEQTAKGFVGIRDAFVYNPATNSWNSLTPLPNGTGRGSAVVGVKGEIIYLAGGTNLIVPVEGGEQVTVSYVSSYNTRTGAWRKLAELPIATEHCGGSIIGDIFYVVGGRTNGQLNVIDNVQKFNLTTRTWVAEGSKMITPRGGIPVATIGNDIFTFGGEGNTDPTAGWVFNQTESYNVVQNKWTSRREMSIPRHGLTAVPVGGKIYVPGGAMRDFAMSGDLVAYRP